MVLIVSAATNELLSVNANIKTVVMIMEMCGVANRGWTRARNDGNSFCSAMANGTLDADRTVIFRLPATEMIAPAEMIAAPAVPMNLSPASANGLVDFASSGSVPMQTT